MTYFQFMVRYYIHEKDILEVAKCYQLIYDTIEKSDDETKNLVDPSNSTRTDSFRNFILYLMIAP